MIKFVDLNRQHDLMQSEIQSAIKSVLDSSEFIMGNALENFEKEFARYCGTKYCIGVGNGGDALRLSVLALSIGKGDEVITVANTFTATVDVIVQSGATPVLIDCDEYFNIDVKKIEKKITRKTKAIIAVHLYGQAANMDEIMRLVKKYRLKLIEDVAQAHGAQFKGKKVGSFGSIGCFSFYPGKNLGALGDGGAIVTNDKKIVDKIKMLRNYGMIKKYYEDIIGYNSRLDTIQAAVLSLKLKRLDKWNIKRREAAALYNKLLQGIVETPKEHKNGKHVYHLYVVKVKSRQVRDKLQDYLSGNQISTVLHYPIPVHLQKAYKFLRHKKGDFPQTERNCETIISLPLFPGITKAEIKKVTATIKKFFKVRS